MQDWTYSRTRSIRRPTRSVAVGDVAVGGDNPIRVQSMTTPATTDTRATVDQIERLVDAGCEIVRVTVPTSKDADNLPAIRAELARRRVRVPLVADIHFTPAAALRAVEHVEKVRINPGNYADKKRFAVREYTDDEYRAELDRIERSFAPLIERSKELGRSMRIGTNHGSLSDRIMNRYGDTPEGMVESALEFVRICEAHGYRELIISMKASNPLVVLEAYRLLVVRMAAQQMDYPLHLGVTEAGDGEDGRIKSAVGIGSLLDEGIGDTVRVSLTEDPVREIPVALALVAPFNRSQAAQASERCSPDGHDVVSPSTTERRASRTMRAGPLELGGGALVRVEIPLTSPLSDERGIRREIDANVGVRVPEETRAELVSVPAGAGDAELVAALRSSLELVAPAVALSVRLNASELRTADEATLERWLDAAHRLHVVATASDDVHGLVNLAAGRGSALLVELPPDRIDTACALAREGGVALALSPTAGVSPHHAYRRLADALHRDDSDAAIVLIDRPAARTADPLLGPAAALGGLLCDGIGDAIHIEPGSSTDARQTSFGILQASRVRITKTEFISCPSCGRTLFDLEETTARIKQRTAHLKGVKIAVMGCVVNGPGEMADADFGYVGWGEDKIALFVGREMVAKDIPTAEADGRLVELIKKNGRWVDPPVGAADRN